MFIDRSYFIGELNIDLSRSGSQALLDLLIQKKEDELLTDLLGYQFYKNFKLGLQVIPVDPMWTNLLNGTEWTDADGRLRQWIGFISQPIDMVSAIDAANSIAVVVGRGLPGDPVAGTTVTTIPASLIGQNFIIEQRQVGQLRTDEYFVSGANLSLLGGKIFSNGDTYFYKSQTLALNTSTGNNKRSLIANYVYYWYMRTSISQTVGSGEVLSKVENSTLVSPKYKMTRAWNEMVDWIYQLYAFLWQNSTVYTDWLPWAWVFGWTPYFYPETRYYQKINSFGI